MKKQIDAFDYADTICRALKRGVLLTTKFAGQVNTMTIGWGTIGIEWGKPVFIAYIRQSRHTMQMLEKSGEFTVNIPLESGSGEILGYCGRYSGRDVDKFQSMHLTAVDSDVVAAPGITQFPLTLECKIIYSQQQETARMPQEISDRYYPPVGQEQTPDIHTAFYGEIVNAYLIESDD